MFIKFTSIVVALLLTLSIAPVLVAAQSKQELKNYSVELAEPGQQSNPKLQMDIQRLLANLKSERDVIKLPRPQIVDPQRSNLSKSTKITIGVAIAVAVVVIILVSKRCSNEPGGC